MTLTYPDKTIWYVGSSAPNGEDEAEGSAVAVRLQMRGEPKTAKTYLLTCGHVVRGATDRKRVIRAWPPDVGYNNGQSRRVIVDTAFKSVPNGKLSEAELRNAADDWIILAFEDGEATAGIDVVRSWIGDNALLGDFRIWGYPGGEQSFSRGKVIPTQTAHTFPFRDAAQGIIDLTGDGARPGLSGGGVFSFVYTHFAGLHRGRLDDALRVSAVSALHVLGRLRELGYEPVAPWSGNGHTLPNALIDDLALDPRIWREAVWKVLPPSSTHEIAPTSSEQAQLADFLRELAELGVDDKGVHPIFRFIHELTKSPHAGDALRRKLNEWLDTSCPPGLRQQSRDSSNAQVTGEPRIVVQMSRSEPGDVRSPRLPLNSAPTAREVLFRYKIWFVGFAHTPPPEDYVDTREGFKPILEQAWSTVRDQHDTQLVWVELFLPKELFAWAVEKEQVRIGPFASPILGASHRFVLRYARSQCSKPLETRWNKAVDRSLRSQQPIRLNSDLPLLAVPQQVDDEHFLVAADHNPDPGSGSAMYYELVKRPNVLGVVWTLPPAAVTTHDGDAWDAVFESGVPLIIWLREPAPANCTIPSPTIHFRNKEWDTIASEVQRLRLSAVNKADWQVGQHLAVILDDPRRTLPSASPNARFRSPASSL
ncbi:hypothetical protein QA633_40230 [Bradyrhizobium barranii]|uniref:VMAP-C domain-containing protein n=1 Tax=Bradyrhizobium barranii TaxID=2992140 RepID=UPI0024AFA1F7|nr:hypothetical protein [Bradyrhizobium barranii]WFT94420.1 hypothetical protein QA633_40230 [Bradyrhizobium barranii]